MNKKHWEPPSHQKNECIQKFPDWVNNEINNNKNKHSSRSNTERYGGKTHKADSPNSDTTAPSGREQYRLQFSFQAANPETFGYALVFAWFEHPFDLL
jgi:hypothetical protein